MIRSRGWGPNKRDQCPYKGDPPESSLPLYPVRTVAHGCLTCPPAHTELPLWLEVRKEMVPHHTGVASLSSFHRLLLSLGSEPV